MSLATRLEALIAQKPGLDAEKLAAHIRERAGIPTPVEPYLDELCAAGRIEARIAGNSRVWHLAGAVPSAEHSGPRGPEPTRFGDWENKGICVDF